MANEKREKTEVEKYFDRHADVYSTTGTPPSKIANPRAGMSFANDITWHFMLKYIPKDKNIKILEAGAGDGYETQNFIKLGYNNFVLLDLSQGMLDQARIRLSKLKQVFNAHFIKSDITNMKEVHSDTFDFVFSQFDAVSYCLKPKLAMKELARVAKKGTYVIVSLDTKFRRVSEYIESKLIDDVKNLLETNISHDEGFPQYNLTWEELAEAYEEAGLEVIEIVGAPVFMHQVDDKILQKLEEDPKIRKELLKIELEYCTNRSLVNFAGHLQMIGKKK